MTDGIYKRGITNLSFAGSGSYLDNPAFNICRANCCDQSSTDAVEGMTTMYYPTREENEAAIKLLVER